MGMDNYTVVGPYLKIENKKVKMINKVWGCVSEKRTYCKDVQFCESCGKKNEFYEEIKIRYPYFSELIENNDDFYESFNNAFPEGEDKELILFSNLEETSDYVEYEVQEITPEIIKKQTDAFLKYHKHHIDFLEKKVKSIQIKFGVAQYMN